MSKKSKPYITQMLAEGQRIERHLEKLETEDEARKLVRAMPYGQAERTIYVRNMIYQALSGKIPIDTFRLFARKTNAWLEIETLLPRAKLVIRRK